jgi:hypothetical protein
MRIYNSFLACVALVGLAGCATTASIVVDQDPAADLASYTTFGFSDDLATDRDTSYSTILTQHLKRATRVELERLGYVYDESAPELRVNFFLHVEDRQDLRTTPVTPGLIGFRGYGAWGGYELETVNYKAGTLRVHLVDTQRNSLVWQGIAEGHVRRAAIENPSSAVGTVIAEIFSRFPGATGA